MRCLLVLVGLHAVLVALNKGQKGKVAGLCLGGLCTLCLLFRSKNALVYHGLAGARAYLEGKGLGVLDIGTAIVVYEALGFLLMVGFWVGCWLVQPVKLGLLQPIGSLFEDTCVMNKAVSTYTSLVEAARSKFDWIAEKLQVDPARLTTSFAESAVARTMLKPLLLPLKLYCAYMFVRVWRDVGADWMLARAKAQDL